MLSKPPSSISLEDKIILTDLLLKSGASINEMNTVRKHMSDIKGGRLAKLANPSPCHSLIISDVINDDILKISEESISKKAPRGSVEKRTSSNTKNSFSGPK